MFALLIVLSTYFVINVSHSLNEKSERELNQSAIRIEESLEIIKNFAVDMQNIGETYFAYDDPKIDKNLGVLEFSNNLTFSTSQRLMELNRRFFGRGTEESVKRDEYYINVAYVYDRFFRDFSMAFSDIISVNYYGRHNFLYSYSNLGTDYLANLRYYPEKNKSEKIIEEMGNSKSVNWSSIDNVNSENQGHLLLSTPVYNHNRVEGLVSINYNLGSIENILKNNFFKTYLIDKEGNIIASNDMNVTNDDGFEKITDEKFFGFRKGNDILKFAFNGTSNSALMLSTDYYKFSDTIMGEYALFLFVPVYSYFIGILLSLTSVFIIGKIIFWLDETYSLRKLVRIELKQKYNEVSRLKDELEKVATTDYLTKLYNRRYLLEKIEKERLENRENDDANFVLLMIDIDHFKNVNDTYGHNVGDEILKSVANTISNNVRKNDYVSRWGGEEMLIVLVNASLRDGQRVAEKVRKKVSEVVNKVDFEEISVTISIGVNLISMTENFDKGLIGADDALYEAKSTGRNKVVVNSENY